MLTSRRINLGAIGGLFDHFAKTDSSAYPTLAELRVRASLLRRQYGQPASFHYAFHGEYPPGVDVPSGTQWNPPAQDLSSASMLGSLSGKKSSKRKKEPDPPFIGDESLAHSTRFIYDTMLFRLATEGTKRGDVGCLWEVMKVSTFL